MTAWDVVGMLACLLFFGGMAWGLVWGSSRGARIAQWAQVLAYYDGGTTTVEFRSGVALGGGKVAVDGHQMEPWEAAKYLKHLAKAAKARAKAEKVIA